MITWELAFRVDDTTITHVIVKAKETTNRTRVKSIGRHKALRKFDVVNECVYCRIISK